MIIYEGVYQTWPLQAIIMFGCIMVIFFIGLW